MTAIQSIIYGLEVAAIGMSVVFVGLILIILLMKVLSWVTGIKKVSSNKPDISNGVKPSEPKAESTPQATVAQSVEPDQNKLIAVITAAIAAILGKPTNGLVVRSFRKVGPSAWSRANREEQIYNKF